MKKQYIWKVKIINRNFHLGVRHIMYVDDETTLEEIKKDYYSTYRKLDGDEFIIINKGEKLYQ